MKNTFKYIILIAFVSFSNLVLSQEKESSQKDISDLLDTYNTMSVPYLSVQMLQMKYEDYIILDTRKKEEFEVSHLPSAIWVGEKYKKKRLSHIDKDAKIVVYCSIGVRSENYGEQLLKDGFSEVFNLYGSIFSWKDAGCEVVDADNEPTENVHVYSKVWAKYLKTGEKIF